MCARVERYELSGFAEIDEGNFTPVESATVGEQGRKNTRGRGSDKQTTVLVTAQTDISRTRRITGNTLGVNSSKCE